MNNPYGFPNTDFYTVDPDQEGNVWITGYLDAGVMLFNPQKGLIKHYFNDADNLYTSGGNFTFDSLIATQGELWLATTNGIFIIDPKTDITSHLRHYMGSNPRSRVSKNNSNARCPSGVCH